MQLTSGQTADVGEAKQLVCDICHNFYQQGWVGGTGGGMSIKTGDLIVMAPSGVQKERMVPSDMFVLDQKGDVLIEPTARPVPYKPPKLSECSPLFMAVRGCCSLMAKFQSASGLARSLLCAGIRAQRSGRRYAQPLCERSHGYLNQSIRH